MGERKRVVVEDYPAVDLPERLRDTFDGDAHVTVTVEAAPAVAKGRSITEIVESVRHLRRGGENAVQRVRDSRDEWERRAALHERIRGGEAD